MQTIAFTKNVHRRKLTKEFEAVEGIVTLRLIGGNHETATSGEVVAEDGVSQAGIQAVIDAHDSGPTQAEQDHATLKAGYQAILDDLDQIQTQADNVLAAVEEIRTRTISNNAQAVAALKDLCVQVKLIVQGVKLHSESSEKTLKGLKIIVG